MTAESLRSSKPEEQMHPAGSGCSGKEPLRNRSGADGLIFSQEFGLLLARAQSAPLIRRELDDLYVPAGYSADEVWDALTVIRRAQAIVDPDIIRKTGEAPCAGWHTMPESLALSIRQIGELTRKGSALDRIAGERAGKRFITQQYVEEAVTNLGLDGFPSSYEEVRSAMLGDVPPQGDAQRLAFNYHRIMCDMIDYSSGPYSPALLCSLYNRLVGGVDEVPDPDRQHSPLEPYYQLPHEFPAEPDETALGIVCGIANGQLTECAGGVRGRLATEGNTCSECCSSVDSGKDYRHILGTSAPVRHKLGTWTSAHPVRPIALGMTMMTIMTMPAI